MDYRRIYRSAAVTFVDLVSRIPGDRLDELRPLVGRTVSSALQQVPRVLAAAGGPVNVSAPEGYFVFLRDVPEAVYAVVTDAGFDGALDTVGELAARATQALAAAGDDDVVATPVGGMRVRDWLPTRTFELVVHGTAVAAAADVPAGFDAAAVSEAAVLATRIAVALGEGEAVLSALTGRSPLPGKFSVLST
ncbi:maleylpyruvate isomerase N-terminal domain-containing protein [Actinoplanes sp. URMC 104]|uniref:maleylpyruvate isomerase N-terminal domain-containing protein n=1 Tax=Actinoplanes sp. URMC 104 TaxID=3423409 RepID=UPI003F1B4563